MAQAKLIILRHGETEDNKKCIITGQTDIPLTKTGEAQARAAGLLLKNIPLNKAYSSNLSRAFNTASLALRAAHKKLPVEKRAEIIEIDTGRFTRLNDNDPVVLQFQQNYETPIPGGESSKDVVARVKKFFDTEVYPHLLNGENVMIVAHAGVVRAFGMVVGAVATPADGMPPPVRNDIPNATPVVYQFDDGALVHSYIIANPKTSPLKQPGHKP